MQRGSDLRLETSDFRLKTSESRHASGISRLKSQVSGLMFLLICIFLCAADTEAAPKPHKVTVGMYNTYFSRDGNLGRAEPDLKEVWEGIPGISEFEACNMTMHYWPRPEDLPQVEAGENRYSAWWKGYMEEAYNVTNQDGEVRFRVIVGPLYSYYTAYKGDVFDGFIEDLCKWEKGSVYEGTLGGWYLTEEPMSSTHNFDPGVSSQMAEAIKAVEKSVGVPHHKMYIDVSTVGKYHTSWSLAAFTQPVDVVIISSGPFLWTTSGRQPVYEPDWSRIHVSTDKIREIVYSDRDRRKMPRPEIHVVLEAWDYIGHGQPTNWEMRQQIHVSFSQSLTYNDPPADGIWFFWWPDIGRNKKSNDTDDWNHGRRLAEAIQTQVARSTFEQNPWERKDYDPPETRFRFPEFGSFNPTYSCIPYDLAEPGYVRVEILDENLSLVKSFDTKYQVAGELRRFGGPYWNRSGARNGSYVFRLYLNSKLMDEVKMKVQWSITVNSTSHLPGVWSTDNVVEVVWEPQAEELEGLAGYSILWNTSPGSYPNTQIDLPPEVTSLRSDPLPDGDSNYFHIRSVNGAGQWSTAAHLGPFYIDTTEPGNVKDLAPDSTRIGLWSRDNRIIVHWNPAEDNASGVMGYSILWDSSPGTLPDKELDISSHTTVLASEPMSDGQYYLHVRSVDNAGNWSHTAAHTGPFLIDTDPPGGVMELVSSSHAPGQWSGSDTVSLSWKDAPDLTSGVVGYSILWDGVPDTVPDQFVDIGKQNSAVSPTLESSADEAYYFHIRGVDAAGNWSDDVAHAGPFLIDTEPPPKVDGLVSTSHNPDEWSPLTSAYIAWDPTEDGISGIARYGWNISQDETIPGEWKETTEAGIKLDIPEDGVWYFQLRAVDEAANRGTSESIVLKVDSKTPSVPTIWSPSHPDDGVWYTDPEVVFEWRSADEVSGIDGYNWSWDTNARTVLDEAKEMDAGSAEILVTAETPGVWYFHLRAVDKAGNWSDTAHYRVQIDPSAPPAPQISSDTHIDGEWSIRNDVSLSWETPGQGPSGITGYSFMLDHSPMSTPDEVADTGDGTYADLPDGILFFHCRAKGGSGIWGPASHYEIRIDTTPPEISITYPQSNIWYTEPIISYMGRVEDYTSGVDWNSLQYSFGDQSSFLDKKLEQNFAQAFSKGLWVPFRSDTAQQGTTWTDQDEIPHCGETQASYLSVRVWDEAGNFKASDPVIIKVDLSISSPTISSPTHPDQDRWYRDNRPEFLWNLIDNYSGLDSYSWALDHSESTVPPEIGMTSDAYTASTKALSDGIWYFHVRARDRAGNWSDAAHYRVKIDTVSPLASVKISGPVVTDRKPPLVRAGRVEVLLQISEPVQKASLKCQTSSAEYPITIELTQTAQADEWRGFFDVTADTGDGEAVFSFAAYDEAGNPGHEITAGESFVIDTIPPTARLEISGPAVTDGDPPLVRSGPVEVLLQASEKILNPSLGYKPSGAVAAVPVELTGDDRTVWSGSFGVTVRTGDGEAVFICSARDEAGNPGGEITEGSSFVVDTLIRAGAYQTAEVLCVSEPATRISLPPGAITQDLRIEVVRRASLSSNVLGVYDFNAYDASMKKLEDLVFRVPVEITFSPELPPGQTGEGILGVYYWDGVRQHKIQDTWTTLRVDYLGRFTLMRSEAMTSRIMNGWAAPNPFTPNGSGDATDRTVFHVATQHGSADFAVKIYDLNGLLVKSLEDGRRVWDGTDEDGKLVEGGLYIYQIKSGEQIISGTVVVLK